MTTTTAATPIAPAAAAPPRHTRRSMLRVYRTEAWQEFLKLMRLPIFAATTVALDPQQRNNYKCQHDRHTS